MKVDVRIKAAAVSGGRWKVLLMSQLRRPVQVTTRRLKPAMRRISLA
jgi:hypothetical protein